MERATSRLAWRCSNSLWLRSPPLSLYMHGRAHISSITTPTNHNNGGAVSVQSAKPSLAILPTSQILRSYFIMSLSSSPVVLDSLSAILRRMLAAKSVLFDIERNPLLRSIFKSTFYTQFCIGDNPAEIRRMTDEMQRIGYHGIILEYANEVLEEDLEVAGVDSGSMESNLINAWRDGLLRTIQLVKPGNFVGVKWSGMGPGALRRLMNGLPPSEQMLKAMTAVCDSAAARGVKMLVAAEPQNAQAAVDKWTCDFAARYNPISPGHAFIYNTYQCYLKSTPATLSKHLAQAAEGNYTLGVKLVRGAYLETEERHLIHDTIDDTHRAYNTIAKELLETRYGDALSEFAKPGAKFPMVDVVLATHNMASVEKARQIRDAQTQEQRDAVPLAYAQLRGMADEVSCELLQLSEKSTAETPRVFKCATWGPMKECLNYLLRRAAENRDAMSRTVDTRRAMGQELLRRIFGDTLLAWKRSR